MLEWEENYFAGEKVREPEKLRREILEGRYVTGAYLLTLSENPEHVLELLPVLNLVQRTARERCPRIIGIARDKEDALRLAQRILMESYERTGTFQVREYLKNR